MNESGMIAATYYSYMSGKPDKQRVRKGFNPDSVEISTQDPRSSLAPRTEEGLLS